MSPHPNDLHYFDNSVRFITALAKSAEQYGGHSHDMDQTLLLVIKTLGLNGEILATPSSRTIAIWEKNTDHQRIHIATSREPAYDMARLEMVRDLIEDVEAGRTRPAEGLVRLQEIERAPAMYGNPVKAIAFFIAGAGFGALMGMSGLEILIGGVLGIFAFGIEILVSRVSRLEHAREVVISVLVAVLAALIAAVMPGIHPMAVTVCALTIYIPGFGLTIAPREIILGDTLSGIIYFMNALVVCLKLLIGTFLGIGIVQTFLPATAVGPLAGISPVIVWVFIPFLLISNGILFGVSPSRFWLLVVCGLLLWAGLLAGNMSGFWQGSFLAAIILTVYARIAANRFRTTLSTILLPAVLMLVPGYTFIQALYLLNTSGIIAGTGAMLQVIGITGAIICGVFVGDILGSFSRVKTP
ncbi:threonine/serine exporter ThrE family protein [Methanoregula sp.]|uniref:threonine/serine ThrE exporter family protein n=1 Tax=Methanoregula sp. TaxID=2052170 RepID=UPI00356A9A39